MDVVLDGSVGCTSNLTISSASLNEVDFNCLSRMTSSRSTSARNVVNYSATRASDKDSSASDVVLFSACKALLWPIWREITLLGPGILSFIYP